MEEKLNDNTLYEEVKDPTVEIKKKISKLAERLFKTNRISQIVKYELTSVEDLPYIRGQPKLHKNNHPMRIVTCSRNTITSGLSQLIFKYIRQLRDTIRNTVSNTTKFVEDIVQVNLNDDERYVSLDIDDLFINMPVTRAVDIIINRIDYSEKFIESTLTKTDLKQLLLLAMNNSYFPFNNKIYKQKRGLPMGNPLSPLLADLFMHDYRTKHISSVCQPRSLWRYVDDILMITRMSEEEVKQYVKELNSIRSRIRFTHEYEQNGSINFLDTTISKGINGRVNIRWIRKETASNRLLHYQSAHHRSIKRNIIYNMTFRIAQTSKDPHTQQKDLNTLKTMLLNSLPITRN